MRDHFGIAISREIAFSTISNTAFELLSVEREVYRCPKWSGSSIGDDVAENGAIQLMGHGVIYPVGAMPRPENSRCRYLASNWEF